MQTLRCRLFNVTNKLRRDALFALLNVLCCCCCCCCARTDNRTFLPLPLNLCSLHERRTAHCVPCERKLCSCQSQERAGAVTIPVYSRNDASHEATKATPLCAFNARSSSTVAAGHRQLATQRCTYWQIIRNFNQL